MKFVKYTQCIFCSSTNLEVLSKVKEYEYMKCKNCGLVFSNPLPFMTKNELDNFYENEYFSTIKYTNKFDKKNYEFFYPIYEKQFFAAKKYLFGKHLLDVGCGTGYFLLASKKYGFDAFGVEVVKEIVRYAKDILNLNVFHGDLFDANFPSNYFDFVRISHVLEHTTNPIEVLKEVNRILKPNGVLEISVPNPYSLLNILLNIYHLFTFKYKKSKYSCSLCPPAHLYGFSKRLLILILNNCGFSILKSFYDNYFVYVAFKTCTSFRNILYLIIDFLGYLIGYSHSLCVYAYKLDKEKRKK